MNLLYTITAYPPSVGGAQACFHELARRLVHRHRVRVVAHWAETRTDWLLGTTLRTPSAPDVRALGSSPDQLTQLLGPRACPRTGYTLDCVPVDLLSLTQAERLRLVPYVFGYYLLREAAISHISSLLLRHLEPYAPVDLIHNGRIGRENLSIASLKLARRLDVPFVLTPFHHPRWVGWNYRHYIELYRQADGVIALTEAEKAELVRLGVRETRIFVTGMGPILADAPDGDSFRRRCGIQGPIVLFLGQKYRYKGCAALLEAAPQVWARFPETTFVFIGPPTRHSRSLFARYDDPRIREMGVVDLVTKTDALAACTLLCLPSTQESFGAVFTEAWMLGKPVIAGASPAAREIIRDGVEGYVVGQEPTAIADRILHLLDHPRLRAQLGEQGRTKTLQHYTWNRLTEATEAAYRSILSA